MGERGAQRGGPGRAGRGAAANGSAGFGWPVAGGGARTRVPGAGRGRRALWEGGGPGAHGGAGRDGSGPSRDRARSGPARSRRLPSLATGPRLGHAGRVGPWRPLGWRHRAGPGPGRCGTARSRQRCPERAGPELCGTGAAQPADPASPALGPSRERLGPSRERLRPRRAGPVLLAPAVSRQSRPEPGCHCQPSRALRLSTQRVRAAFIPGLLVAFHQETARRTVPPSSHTSGTGLMLILLWQLEITQQTEVLSAPRIRATVAVPCDLLPFGTPGQS
ncbi:myosin heavy chain IB-like [Serinus canaria]|uniref:myosin heavy chain IB-like n=1 Tax=Serinus canaria TaxID=9135 RepID=UPI0021CC5607|nr:myosin heavy chain IB-like [Serinus canaria]